MSNDRTALDATADDPMIALNRLHHVLRGLTELHVAGGLSDAEYLAATGSLKTAIQRVLRSLTNDGDPLPGDIYDYPEGTTSTCVHCGSAILLDQREGGGPGKDWGASPADWVGHGGIGMDYGCGDNPDSDEEGTAGHEPDPSRLTLQD